MIRMPHEPQDALLVPPLGERVTRTGEKKAEAAKPYTNYTPIKGRPGWEDDGFGHQRYDATRDAVAHERKMEDKIKADKKVALLPQGVPLFVKGPNGVITKQHRS
jgi:hypothetical protein